MSGDECRTHRDLGLAETDIAANEPIHRFPGCHIANELGNGTLLIRGLFKREGLGESRVLIVGLGEGEALARVAQGLHLQQFYCRIVCLFLCAFFRLLPGVATQFV